MSIGGNRVQIDNDKLNYTKYNIVLLSFIRSMPNSIYNINNPLGVKYLTKLKIGFSHLKQHNFKHKFQDSIDPMQLQ